MPLIYLAKKSKKIKRKKNIDNSLNDAGPILYENPTNLEMLNDVSPIVFIKSPFSSKQVERIQMICIAKTLQTYCPLQNREIYENKKIENSERMSNVFNPIFYQSQII
ncbi:hypothetical protein BpHYR1_015598 [Brachionus plicatilis]|uniref:Uncharacterized protein n=1 Tax=Brachionus plicatilis TaxID=10195 RepID=A0A3M7PS24_BRAPC|nr:hypothetical protein BpHYR1_015598 [Brachionus plicatilis]